MSVLAILMISGFFVLAAMVGLADAFLHLVMWAVSRLTTPRTAAGQRAQAPAHGITA